MTKQASKDVALMSQALEDMTEVSNLMMRGDFIEAESWLRFLRTQWAGRIHQAISANTEEGTFHTQRNSL